MLEESQQKQRQAQSRLEKEREELQAAIAQHNFANAGEDGEHIKPNLKLSEGE